MSNVKEKIGIFNGVIKKNEYLTSPEPYLIRGHHLPAYVRLIYLEGIDLSTNNLTRRYKSPAEAAAHNSWFFSDDSDYRKDVYGNTNEGFGRHIVNTTGMYEKFLNLSSNHPVHLVEDQIDEICKLCVTGIHCKQFVEKSSDIRFLDFFVNTAQQLNKEKELKISQEVVTFNDAESSTRRRVKTTIEPLRDTLTYLAEFYSDLDRKYRYKDLMFRSLYHSVGV